MKLKERIHRFLHDEKLKRKLYVIIFESDTPAGKLFDVILIACILVSVLLVIIESLKGLPTYLTTPFVIMEFLFTGFFTFEYLEGTLKLDDGTALLPNVYDTGS